MCLAALGYRYDVSRLVRLSGTESRWQATDVVSVAAQLGFAATCTSREADALSHEDVGSILCWERTHFVVLASIDTDGLDILDPVFGQRRVTRTDATVFFDGTTIRLQPHRLTACRRALWSRFADLPGSWASRTVHEGAPRPAPSEGSAPLYEGRPAESRLPHWLIIGSARAGTTSLWAALIQHPEIQGSIHAKEVRFFTEHWARGVDWYRSHFPGGSDALLCEASPCYFLIDDPSRITRVLPWAKFVLIVRNPVARLRSHYEHERRLGVVQHRTFREFAAAARARAGLVQPVARDYWRHGLYEANVGRWLEVVPPSRLLIVTFDDLVQDWARTRAKVLTFVGANDRNAPLPRRNASSYGTKPAERDLRHVEDAYADDWDRFVLRMGWTRGTVPRL